MQMELASKLQHNKANWKDTAFAACVAAWINRLKNRLTKPETAMITADGACSICFEDMKSGDELTRCELTCKNSFHFGCMKLWLDSGHNTCPLCRAEWVEVREEIIDDAADAAANLEVSLLPVGAGATAIVNSSLVETKTDIVFSFDTTGSMSSCIADVRRNIEKVSTKLFDEIP
jgi:hypothetical protein